MKSTNPLLAQARGGLGKIVVFKQMYGKTVMTNYPRKVTTPREEQSAAQRGTRDNFRNAAAHAKHILKDPSRRAYYEKMKKKLGLYSAYHAAITDYMRKLRVEAGRDREDRVRPVVFEDYRLPPLILLSSHKASTVTNRQRPVRRSGAGSTVWHLGEDVSEQGGRGLRPPLPAIRR